MPGITDTPTQWSSDFDTLRREHLFRNPPKDTTPYPDLAEAFKPHIESFNAIFDKNGILEHGLQDIGTKSFTDGDAASESRNTLHLRVREYFVDKPTLPSSNKFSTTEREIYPNECRERHCTYKGRFNARLEFKVNDGDWRESVRNLGQLPLMLRSNKCHLQNFSPAQLVEQKEEAEEFGGYFIVNGIERLVRMLILPKRNYPTAIVRNAFKDRGPTYSEFGVSVRSVRLDQTSQTNVLHYLNDGNVTFRFSWRKQEYLVPLMMVMKALVETNDREILQGLLDTTNEETLKERQFVIDRVEMLLRTYKAYGIHGKAKARSYLGSKFRPVVLGIPDYFTDEQVGDEFLRKIVLPHLGSYNVDESHDHDKFRFLLFMLKKLYALVEGKCSTDNPDAMSAQELLLSGFLYGTTLKERLEEWLGRIGSRSLEWCRDRPGRSFADPEFMKDLTSKVIQKTSEDIGKSMEYFLATGNLTSPTGLDLQQTSGFTLVPEKLNFLRFISHFSCVHRGAFFAELKTTSVRKLLPESWGFMCPVHTPDGAPCGLLNHLAHKCKVATSHSDVSAMPKLLASLGVSSATLTQPEGSLVIQLDGRILGFCAPDEATTITSTIRRWKVQGTHSVPRDLEIGYVPPSLGGQYPGIYMFSHPARMYRPVKHLTLDSLDYIGPFEQPHMSIACTEPEIPDDNSTTSQYTHVEETPHNILSILANLTPFSDFNQSPRNMYQCQMAKQTMGTPGNALVHRTEHKSYRLQTGQTPIVRPALHNAYGVENFPNGTNAVVAVISYTGYDMDDAMIINKSAHERGLADGTIYITHNYNLDESDARGKSRSHRGVKKLFGFAPGGLVRSEWRSQLDDDGLPVVGRHVREGDIIAAWHAVEWDAASRSLINHDGKHDFLRFRDMEAATVEQVRLHGTEDGTGYANSMSVKFRIHRPTVIGDKFSSRHGQKGVCSQKWPATDMPFSENGIIPDIIINPHAFPSRMTIGMFIESLAGKSGALHGLAQDSRPWQFEDKKGSTAVEYFGEQLKTAGYNYYGNEPMYSGITGEEFGADIYMGVVYYQRLRHMVNDKFQVRTTGPVNPQTGQPIKGRSRGGGIRVGEMEKDALIAHGTAFLLQDRLLNCSDYTKSWICKACGSFLSTTPSVRHFGGPGGRGKHGTNAVRCFRCASRAEAHTPKCDVWEDGDGNRWMGGEDTTVVAIPGVLRCLDLELAGMGVKMRFKVGP